MVEIEEPMAKKNGKSKKNAQVEELKYVPGRKVACVMMLVAAVLALIVALFSLFQGTIAWVAIFGALSAIAFYMAYMLRAELRQSH